MTRLVAEERIIFMQKQVMGCKGGKGKMKKRVGDFLPDGFFSSPPSLFDLRGREKGKGKKHKALSLFFGRHGEEVRERRATKYEQLSPSLERHWIRTNKQAHIVVQREREHIQLAPACTSVW
jgi:hypothetical protein